MNNCRLCSGLVPQHSAEAWNEPLFQSPNFVVLPSLGALVEGWLLLLPKEHYVCTGAFPDSIIAEMHEMKHFLCSVLKQVYGQVCTFEHGPSEPNRRVGCSVDHAHIHFVPMTIDLFSTVMPFLPENASWSEGGMEECRSAFLSHQDYLYFEQPLGVGRIITHSDLGSQIFRRAIAKKIGKIDQFNWREYPQLSNVSATIKKMQAWNGDPFLCKNLSKTIA